MPYSQRKYIEVWNLLNESIPGLEQRLRKEGTPGVSVVSNKLQGGRRSTLAACVDNVKKCSRDWGFVPPLPAEKRDRGFYNDVCGHLLCPAHLDWDDPTVRAGLRNHEYRTYRIGSSRLPRLLWADGVMGDIPSVGFLRNELLLKTVALILRGPEAAKVVTSVGGPPMHYSVNSKPRAAIWHIYRVTPGCIAASATLLRFALSSHTRFSLSADQEQVNHEEVVTATIWPYRAFYQRIQRCFQVMPEGMRNELLDWYTQRVLGDAAFYSDGDDESDVDGESELATLETAFGQGNDN